MDMGMAMSRVMSKCAGMSRTMAMGSIEILYNFFQAFSIDTRYKVSKLFEDPLDKIYQLYKSGRMSIAMGMGMPTSMSWGKRNFFGFF